MRNISEWEKRGFIYTNCIERHLSAVSALDLLRLQKFGRTHLTEGRGFVTSEPGSSTQVLECGQLQPDGAGCRTAPAQTRREAARRP